MVRIEIISNTYNCVLELERRVTYIRGMSGVGKSTMVEKIRRFNNGAEHSTKVICDRKVIPLDILEEDTLSGYKGRIVILDDSLATEAKNFNTSLMGLAVKYDVYLVIINRVDRGGEDVIDPEDLPIEFSVNSILLCKTNGKNHWFVKQIDELNKVDLGNQTYDCIIAEDTYGSSTFSHNVFGIPVIKSEGKDNIIFDIMEAKEKGYKSIFVFVDTAAFGRGFHDFMMYTSALEGVEIYFDSKYECFEYLLLVSNFLKDEYEKYLKGVDLNNYRHWEEGYEKIIHDITFNKRWSYNHGGKVKSCYYKECDKACNKYESDVCDKYKAMSDVDKLDKIVYLFKSTIFEYLISMRNNHRK